MDKLDYFGITTYSENESNPVTNEKKSIKGTDFASFLRDETNKNLHLNLYTNKIPGKNAKFENLYRLKNLSKEEMAAMLVKRIILVKDDYVLLNKPNGISVEGGNIICFSILDVIPQLSKVMNLKENLQVVHRLDKDTTGALILARNPEMAFFLKDAFKKRQITKTYLCLTHGIPYPSEGIIDFPLKESSVDGHFMITPDRKSIDRRERGASSHESPVTTTYKTLCDNYNVALLQCQMTCGRKHQVRAHLAYGLDTAVLGDHKYAWFLGADHGRTFPILPQTLSPVTLAGLGLAATKTRHLPIHLHAHRIVVSGPPAIDLQAPLPPFFVDTLRRLRLFDAKMIAGALKRRL